MHEPGLPGGGAAAGHGEAEDAEPGAGGRAGEARGPPAAPSLATNLAHREQPLQVSTLPTNLRSFTVIQVPSPGTVKLREALEHTKR